MKKKQDKDEPEEKEELEEELEEEELKEGLEEISKKLIEPEIFENENFQNFILSKNSNPSLEKIAETPQPINTINQETPNSPKEKESEFQAYSISQKNEENKNYQIGNQTINSPTKINQQKIGRNIQPELKEMSLIANPELKNVEDPNINYVTNSPERLKEKKHRSPFETQEQELKKIDFKKYEVN